MGITYENQRVIFNGILKKYLDYVNLYRVFNNGSIEGITPFHEFYWRFTYFSRYSNPRNVENRGF
jgi:hypothetical protein